MSKKPAAAISLDLDNLWSYMKVSGVEGWDKYPSYLDVFIPHILDLLDEMDLKITFFVVGKDTESEINRKYLRMITKRGHEVGNHSYNHDSWLQNYSYNEIEKEIIESEEAILSATGQKPRGFRGPGFSWSNDILKILVKRGYKYDASTFPTFLGPIARLYYFRKSNLSREERKTRKDLFGKFRDGFRKLKPHYHEIGERERILEIPVTTMPVLRLPFHLTYLMYLSNYSISLMNIYLNFSLFMCKITNTPVSFLLHPTDLIGYDKATSLTFFPGMNISTDRKTDIFKRVIRKLKNDFLIHKSLDHIYT